MIIQQDEAYFLFETLQVLEKNKIFFKEFELTVLVDQTSLSIVSKDFQPLLSNLISDPKSISEKHFDLSVNLSLRESSWDLHNLVASDKKIGPYKKNNQICVNDLWSSYLMTLKAKAPFLTFHLQDVYRNILGIKGPTHSRSAPSTIRKVVFGATAPHLFAAEEQESLIHDISLSYPNYPLKDISEIDLLSDLTSSLYVGPLTLEALKFCEAGGRGIFLSSTFQGFNLLPYGPDHIFLSSRGEKFKSSKLLPFIENLISGQTSQNIEYSLYSTEHENIFGAYLKSHNFSDDNYPFYQSHVVLWNFLLNMFDTDLQISKCNSKQIELLKTQQGILSKYIRLHDYAMVSIDTIYHQSRAKQADPEKVEGHLKNLIEIDRLSDQISQNNSLLRPVLDFYRIRRGQNEGETLSDQSQISFLTYSEEHQALQALNELFSVTLKGNEVNI